MRITSTERGARAAAVWAADPRLRMWLACGAIGLALWALLAVWTPPDDSRWSVCVFQRVTHHDCATCGMTRAFASLGKGDFAGAARHHPLALPLAAEAVLLWLAAPLAWRLRWPVSTRLRDGCLLGHAGVLIAAWVVRLAR